MEELSHDCPEEDSPGAERVLRQGEQTAVRRRQARVHGFYEWTRVRDEAGQRYLHAGGRLRIEATGLPIIAVSDSSSWISSPAATVIVFQFIIRHTVSLAKFIVIGGRVAQKFGNQPPTLGHPPGVHD